MCVTEISTNKGCSAEISPELCSCLKNEGKSIVKRLLLLTCSNFSLTLTCVASDRWANIFQLLKALLFGSREASDLACHIVFVGWNRVLSIP